MGCSPAAQKNQTNNLLHLGIVDLLRGIGGAMIVWMEAGMKKEYRHDRASLRPGTRKSGGFWAPVNMLNGLPFSWRTPPHCFKWI